MRPKTLSLAAIAAVAAMAFVGTSSVMAEETALCSVSQSPCEEGNLVTSVHAELASEASWELITGSVDILCLSTLLGASALEPGAPQAIDITSLTYENCGTKASHENCEIESAGYPHAAELLRTAENLGSIVVTDEGAEIDVECENIDTFGLDIECTYSFTGQSFHVEGATEGSNGMLNPNGGSLEEVGSDALCPNTTEVTEGLLELLEATYIAQGEGDPGIKITLPAQPGEDPHLFGLGQVKKVTITNERANEIELYSEKIEAFESKGKTCNTLKLKNKESCTHRELECIQEGILGGFTVKAEDLGTEEIVEQTLLLHCHTKKALGKK